MDLIIEKDGETRTFESFWCDGWTLNRGVICGGLLVRTQLTTEERYKGEPQPLIWAMFAPHPLCFIPENAQRWHDDFGWAIEVAKELQKWQENRPELRPQERAEGR